MIRGEFQIIDQLIKIYTDFPESIGKYLYEDFSYCSNEEKEKHVSEVIRISSKFAAGIAPIPIPIADIWLITPIQIAMVRSIGNIYGYKLTKSTVKEIIGVIGGGIIGQQICLALFKIGLPGAGGFGGAVFVWIWTKAMGKTANHFFKNKMTLSKQEIEDARKQFMSESQEEYTQSKEK